jgi:aryl carrier-like protein
MLACGIEKGGGGFRVCASFDGGLIGVREMERVLAQLEMACVELARDIERGLDQISCVPAGDLDQIWEWNRDPPLTLDATSGKFVMNAGLVEPGLAYNPRAAIPWVCDLRNPSMLAPIGCPGELWLEAAFLTGDDVVDSPAWLIARSSQHAGRIGKAQPTGSIVKLQDDGTMVFVGRKDTNTAVNAHGTAPTELGVHLTKYLPLSVNATAVLAFQGSSRQSLVVFMERPEAADGESTINVIQEEQVISSGSFITTLSTTVPVGLVSALKRLNKFAQNSLASHLVPSAYLIMDKLPTTGNQIDRSILQQLADDISERVLEQLRDGLHEAWKVNPSSETTTTTAEDILRSSWAAVLGLEPNQIDPDDNFFRLGGDSVLAMKLVSRLRSQGHGLTVGDIFRHMRLGDAAKVLKVNKQALSSQKEAREATSRDQQSYRLFSTLSLVDVDQFVTGIVRPQLGDANWVVQDVYPVTASQALDIKATIESPRTSIQYTFLFSDKGGFDRATLLQAHRKLVEAHDILRTVFIEHGSTLLQVVLKDLDIPVSVKEADEEDLDQFIRGACADYTESDSLRLGSPFLHTFLAHGKDGQECLAIGLSHAQYDGVSLPLLLRDLDAFYTGSSLVTSFPFSSYITQTLKKPAQTQALTYWSTLLSNSTPSILPGQPHPSNITTSKAKAIFHTTALSTTQPPSDTTTATLLTAAWSLVLARRLRTTDVTFGSITSGRASELTPAAESVVGPCYQFTPVRVPFRAGWTARELLGFVQRQGAEGLAYDFVGVGAIAERVGWETKPEGGVFFDSIVHHQDWEDFDVMPFGGGECKVDVWNPHGDAAYPLKVVSFFKSGELHVGVVGSEEDVVFVDEVLAELAGAVKELVELREERPLLDRAIFSDD